MVVVVVVVGGDSVGTSLELSSPLVLLGAQGKGTKMRPTMTR